MSESIDKKQVVFLADDEITLRPPELSDIETFVVWMNDPEIWEYLGRYLPVNCEEERAFVTNLKQGIKDIVLVICYQGRAVGVMGLHKINWKERHATTGSVIGDKALWGKKIGRRAKLLLLKYAFEELGLNKINSDVIEFNERSLRYSLACGYQVEGRIRQQYYRKGRFWDQIMLGITRADWDKRKEEKK